MARTSRTPKRRHDWKPAWLAAFAEQGTVSKACEAAGVGRTTVYDARSDEEFAQAWDDVEAQTTDTMEREAFRRAVEGTEKPVFQGGAQVGAIREFSDTLLIFMLKARKPATYRENVRVEHSGPDGGPIEQVTVPADVDRAREVAAILAEAGAAVVNGKAAHANGNGHNGAGSD